TAPSIRRDGNAPAGQLLQQLPLRTEWQQRRIVCRHGVSEKSQRSPCGDGGVELPQRTGGRISRICEHRLARLNALFVHSLETVEGHVYFAADFNLSRWRIASQSQR